MKLNIDEESVHIFIDNGFKHDVVSLLYWHIDEIDEDASVCISISKAIQLFYTDKKELLKTLRQ